MFRVRIDVDIFDVDKQCSIGKESVMECISSIQYDEVFGRITLEEGSRSWRSIDVIKPDVKDKLFDEGLKNGFIDFVSAGLTFRRSVSSRSK